LLLKRNEWGSGEPGSRQTSNQICWPAAPREDRKEKAKEIKLGSQELQEDGLPEKGRNNRK
jgi:hypothetical protein